MAVQTFSFQPGTQILTPVQIPSDAKMDAAGFAASTTFLKGQALARKTADNLLYPLNAAASDGTQNFVGFAAYSFKTDGNSKIFYVTGSDAAGVNYYAMPMSTAPIYLKGVFDPNDLITAAGGSAVAEVDTFTPTTVTTGDINQIQLPTGDVVQFTIAATATAAAAVTGLTAAWNANQAAAALATASGSTTFILTAKTPGRAMNLTSSVVGTGTLPKVVTTAAVAANQAEVDTITPTTVTTGDVNTVTYTAPDLTTQVINFTVGATATAAAVVTGLTAAWNANPTLVALGTPSGTTTFIVTSNNPGNPLNLTTGVTGTGTLPKVVTTPTSGRSIADILPGAPGARVLHNGYWEIP